MAITKKSESQLRKIAQRKVKKQPHNVNCIEEYNIDDFDFRMMLQLDTFLPFLKTLSFKNLPFPSIRIADIDNPDEFKDYSSKDLEKMAFDNDEFNDFLGFCIHCGL